MTSARLGPDQQPIHLQQPLWLLRWMTAPAGFMAFAVIAPLLYRAGEHRTFLLAIGVTFLPLTVVAAALLGRYRVTYDPARGTVTRRALRYRVLSLVDPIELTERPARMFQGYRIPAAAVLAPGTDGRGARPLRLSDELRSPEGFTTDDVLAELLVRAPRLDVADPQLQQRLRRAADDGTPLPLPRPARPTTVRRVAVLVLCAVVLVRAVQVIPALSA